ncbi:MAG TPA: flagellar assembly peptidoglycan hydrolase FlgJ [Paenalcaligenes sp.]|nr:flagellar assembly peptidoglycan hydrolase FlgJ [Paenalcaligenes sp.]
MSTLYFPRPGAHQVNTIFDTQRLALLQNQAAQHPQNPNVQAEIAQQFESIFIQQILKYARQSAALFGAEQSSAQKMAYALNDEQLSLALSDPGLGLAQALQQQMREQSGVDDFVPYAMAEQAPSRKAGLRSHVGKARVIEAPDLSSLIRKLTGHQGMEQVISAIKGAPAHIQRFVDTMRTAAEQAAAETGIPMKLILSQAALESGWGQRQITHEDGRPTFNLFGIKAGSNWSGPVAEIMTTEFLKGRKVKMPQPFRAYASYEESFSDYARLISGQNRYASVLAAESAEDAAHRIQEAGYATDPKYAQKLISIMAYFDSK